MEAYKSVPNTLNGANFDIKYRYVSQFDKISKECYNPKVQNEMKGRRK